MLVRLISGLFVTAAMLANETSYRSLQSGTPPGATPLHDRGLRGEGQIIAILDTGLDYDNCYFAEPDHAAPPINTGFQGPNVDLSRRKVIAYDFLYSCVQYPGAPGCDDPSSPTAYDNQGHGTHAAGSAAGDKGVSLAHDYADAIAPAAKLIVQDAGYVGGDFCSQFPALGCPIRNLEAILDLAYRQGARIHSNSWGDRQGTPLNVIPPTANYPASARLVDEFICTHPDMVILFNTGNAGESLGSSSLSAPGSAKNTIQVGGTRQLRFEHRGDDVLTSFSGRGPTRDGRIKPDVVGPAWVLAGDSDFNVTTGNCDARLEGGTSWSSPTIAGAVALIRQYYTEGFYPAGRRTPGNERVPSAALLKATLIASARGVPYRVRNINVREDTEPVPSYEQGFGFPVLDDALYFTGDRSGLRIVDAGAEHGLAQGSAHEQSVTVQSGTRLKVVLVWTDPPGTVSGPTESTPQLVNDLDMTVRDPAGRISYGNERLHPGTADRRNNVEVVEYPAPEGTYQISVRANRLAVGDRQSFALVIVGDFLDVPARRRPARFP